MAPVRAARFCPFCGGKLAEAFTNEPLWMNTRTGACDGSGFGVQMFNLRQSSLPLGRPLPELSCAQLGEGVVKLRVAGAQGIGGCGALHRRPPVGGAANGLARNAGWRQACGDAADDHDCDGPSKSMHVSSCRPMICA